MEKHIEQFRKQLIDHAVDRTPHSWLHREVSKGDLWIEYCEWTTLMAPEMSFPSVYTYCKFDNILQHFVDKGWLFKTKKDQYETQYYRYNFTSIVLERDREEQS